MTPIPTPILVFVFLSGDMDSVVLRATITNSTVPAIVHANPETPSSRARLSPSGLFKAPGGLLKAAETSPPQTSIRPARAIQLFLRIFNTCHSRRT